MVLQPIIFVHIPKTGGSTIHKNLAGQLCLRTFHDREPNPLSSRLSKKNLRALLRPTHPPADAEYIYGHFPANKHRRRYPNARYATWFRHPVERLVSHYYFWLRKPDYNNTTCMTLIKKRLGLVQFAALAKMRNVHRRFLDGRLPDDFDFVGIVEHYAPSLALFKTLFFAEAPLEFPADNVNPLKKLGAYYPLDPSDRAAIESYNRADLALYERARACFHRLCSHHLGVRVTRMAREDLGGDVA